jgi:hypothetical protein
MTSRLALTVRVDLIHDIGLFVFEAAWVGRGVALLPTERRKSHGVSPAEEPGDVANIVAAVTAAWPVLVGSRRPRGRSRP